MTTARVALVEDQALIRQGVELLLRRIDGVDLVGSAATCADGVALLDQTRPDIAVIDLGLPDGNGIELVRLARSRWPQTRVIVLSSRDDLDAVGAAFSEGAVSYLFKSSSGDDLTAAIEMTMQGRRYLTPELADRLAQWVAAPAVASLKRLSSRQRQILRLVAAGKSTKQIAADLSISVTTVNTHRAQLMRRLDIHDVASLTRFAIEQGLLPRP